MNNLNLTYNHFASKNGIPVLVDKTTGNAYQPQDVILPRLGVTACEWVATMAGKKGTGISYQMATLYCAQWADGPQPKLGFWRGLKARYPLLCRPCATKRGLTDKDHRLWSSPLKLCSLCNLGGPHAEVGRYGIRKV